MKIGVAILTCNRVDMFRQCVNSIPGGDGELIIVNDGNPYKPSAYPGDVEVIQHPRNLGIAASKNEALRKLITLGCEHLFLIEDDVIIKRPDVFEKYIEAASKSGIWHLNYGLHGSYNRDENNQPRVKNTLDYDGAEVMFYHNILGAFSYYLKGVIKNVGYMDERYHNAFEHVDHTYRIIQKGLHPPFWWFADIANSWEYIEDQTKNYEGSVIRDDKDFQKNFKEAMGYFNYKFGCIPQRVPETPEEEVLKQLEEIQKNYARPTTIR